MTYWEKRAIETVKRMEGRVKDAVPELMESFKAAQRDLQKEINSFYGRYAAENQITFAEAQKQLNFAELRAFRGNLKEYQALAKKSIGTYNLQLNNLSTKARITRLQALEFECDTVLQRLYQEMQENVNRAVTEVYTNQFYHSQYDIEQYTGFQHVFSKVSQAAIDRAIAAPVQGADISTRLWRQDVDTGFKIRQTLNQMFVTGKPPQDFAESLQKIIGKRDSEGNLTGKKYEAYRLLYNESSYASSQANLEAYRVDGIGEYEICAVLDLKTSQICRGQDSKHYPLDKAVVGETINPFHVNCRTTTIPYIEGLKTTRMARDLKTGKSVRVKKQSFHEWYQGNIDKYGEQFVKSEELKLKNERSDFTQYEKYKVLLGANAPKSFANFQELKYNHGEEYEGLKLSAKGRNHLQKQLAYIYSGEKQFIPQNALIKSVKTIAGKSTDVIIRAENRLITEHGGEKGEWLKCVGKVESDKYIFDVHWYELNKIQYETKLKYRKERKI